MIARLLLTSLALLGASAYALEFTAPGDATEYQFDQPGTWCFVGYALNTNGDVSAPSNEVCKDTPALLQWQAPVENVDGTPLTDLASYRFEATETITIVPPGEVTNFAPGTWTITVTPPLGEYLSFGPQQVTGPVSQGNFNVDPDAGLRIQSTFTRQPESHFYSRLVSKGSAPNGTAHTFMLGTYGANRMRFRLTTSAGYTQLNSDVSFQNGVANIALATYDGSEMCLTLNDTVKCVPKTGSIQQNNDEVTVAGNPNNYGPFVGELLIEMGRF